ncbi:MAG: response regulator [Bacteroidota bacterium]
MSSSQNHTVWIIEDDLDDRILLQEAFIDTQIPCTVSIFGDAFTALQQLGTCSTGQLPSIIVSDYNMPVMNGAEFMEALCVHARYEPIKKIILSTSTYLFDTEACLEKGAHAYFIKPSSYHKLVDVAFSILSLSK